LLGRKHAKPSKEEVKFLGQHADGAKGGWMYIDSCAGSIDWFVRAVFFIAAPLGASGDGRSSAMHMLREKRMHCRTMAWTCSATAATCFQMFLPYAVCDPPVLRVSIAADKAIVWWRSQFFAVCRRVYLLLYFSEEIEACALSRHPL
jgi:hypothetical protein